MLTVVLQFGTAALDPSEWREFKLSKKMQVSHNVVKLRFDLQTPTTVLGLPIGQHVSCRWESALLCVLSLWGLGLVLIHSVCVSVL